MTILIGICIETKVHFDISVNNDAVLLVTKEIQRILYLYPWLKPLVFYVKIILKKYALDISYSGGLNNFFLFNMVWVIIY